MTTETQSLPITQLSETYLSCSVSLVLPSPDFNITPLVLCSRRLKPDCIADVPVCASQGQSVGVGKGEEARVVCQVDANPPPTNFK